MFVRLSMLLGIIVLSGCGYGVTCVCRYPDQHTEEAHRSQCEPCVDTDEQILTIAATNDCTTSGGTVEGACSPCDFVLIWGSPREVALTPVPDPQFAAR